MGPSDFITQKAVLRVLFPVFWLPFLGTLSVSSFAAPPANDHRANAVILASQTPVSVSSTNIDATIESGENTLGGICGASVWYRWSPTTSGWMEIHTNPSDPDNNLDTVIALYETGKGLLGFNDQFLNNNYRPSRLVFYAIAGVTYEIGVYGYNSNIVDEWDFELKIDSIPVPSARIVWATVSPNPVLIDPVSGCDVTVDVAIVSSTNIFPAGSQDGRIDALPISGSSIETAGFNSNNLNWGSATDGRYQSAFNIAGSSPTGQWILRVAIPTPGTQEIGIWTPRGDDLVEDLILMNENSDSRFQVLELSGLPLWRKRSFGSPESLGIGADFSDPDSDGIINFLEFASGTPPLTRNPSPTSVSTQTGIVFRFKKGKQATAAGVQFLVEWTNSLTGAWRTDSISLLKVAEDADSETFEASVSQAPSNTRFFRLRAEK